jgi:hypothetical protein
MRYQEQLEEQPEAERAVYLAMQFLIQMQTQSYAFKVEVARQMHLLARYAEQERERTQPPRPAAFKVVGGN